MLKFSIIIPVYNVAPYLRECLGSLLVQTYPGWEAICVDDGSTDGSGAILDEYAINDSRFIVMHCGNGGVSKARNAALDIASGEYVSFMDPDDYYPDDLVFAHVAEIIVRYRPSAICGGVRVVNENSSRERESLIKVLKNKTCGVLQYREHAEQLAFQRYFISLKEIRKSGAKFPPISMWEDPPFLVQVLACIGTYYAMEKDSYSYRCRDVCRRVDWSADDARRLKDALTGLALVVDLAEKYSLERIFREVARYLAQRGSLRTMKELRCAKTQFESLISRLRGKRVVNAWDWLHFIDSGFLCAEPWAVRVFELAKLLGVKTLILAYYLKILRKIKVVTENEI